ncbi:tetracycline resistance efflux pump [Saccharopolyspora lacisalsi]|uniref:Tetracycline resistance efflux pump n=1 Tax=Halosaccharopolyspora lacisalsi TaxID=1000566 RepID=A0A839E0G4_9PSEU|nr:Na+/H+ antiporter NhaC family protein [Halosaccharopolyspora lacisalsi]MBA8824468.1 tetracycline resistance efflux pump [Halosaccharopolyspora lacisalsi]
MADSVYSLIPPVLAIVLVILTRKVLLSLGAGIAVGLLMLNQFRPLAGLEQLYTIVSGIFVADGGLNTGKVFNLGFLLFLGMVASLVTVCGGSRAFGQWATGRVRTRVGATFVPVALGLIIFIDDYFNALVVGNVSRPIADRQRISRAKLAYMIDSTSAPVCVVMPVSSWGAYIISILAGILATHGLGNLGSLEAFVRMVPLNYYAILALLMICCVAWFRLDVGPMREHERRAVEGGGLTDPAKGAVPGDENQLAANENGRVRDLVWPIAALVLASVVTMIVTGVRQSEGGATLLSVFENTDVPTSLLCGSVLGWITAMILTVRRKTHRGTIATGLRVGIKSMLPAIWILLFAWTMIEVISGLGTGGYLAGLVDGSISLTLLPMLVFILSGFMAFSTGSSWGTFGVLLPIAADIAASTDITLMLPLLAAVLAGAIFGDHCSPISDTTILSSAGAGSHHVDHVMTQLPYALAVAAFTVVGYLVLGLTGSTVLGLLAAVLLLAGTVALLRKTTTAPEEPSLEHEAPSD